jgi:hypothetical protein
LPGRIEAGINGQSALLLDLIQHCLITGYFDYDHNSRRMLYIPAPLNRDSIDTFDIYAINEQGDWDIASCFFDPATREMTFAANISMKPAIQDEKAGLDDITRPRPNWPK